jgi:predicted secreted Zn-dependent protease
MRGYRPSGESDLDYEDEEEGYRPRPKRPAPGKVTRTMRMDGRVIARRSTGDGDSAIDTSGVQGLLERTSGGGQALPDSLRGSFEESLGVRLADVRVHTGGESAEVARSIAAKAFTVGQDIHFAAGQYDPSSAGGKHLLAHEVAHTAQQAAGGTHVHTKLEVSQAGDAIESEADAAADAMVAGHKASVSAAPIAAARTPDGSAQPAGPAGASDPNADASARADKPNTVTVNITPKAGKMELNAETYLDLYKLINEKAQNDKCCGKCICAADFDATAIDKYQLTVTVSLTKEIPVWNQIAKQPKEHQDKFNAWAASVKAHEDTHYKKYEDAYNSLKTKLLKCATDAEAQKIFKDVDEAVEKDQKAFDDNKANQPAPLPIPGGIEKIDSTPGAKKSATEDPGAAAEPAADPGTAGPVARKASGDGTVDTSGVSGLVARTRGGGDALPDSLRGSFEESLGARLGGVRVHTDGQSAEVARSIAAKAFTVGQDIYFGAGQYDPSSEGGKHLIAHEVAHTAQQAAGGTHVHTKLEVSQAGDAIETEADAAADAMIAGHKAMVSAAPVAAARTPDGAQPAGPATGGQDAEPQGDGAPTKVTVKVTVNPKSSAVMEFDAPDYNDLYQQVSKRATTNKCAGFCECGTAQCNYVIWTSADNTKKLAKELSIEVDITTSSPTWKQIATQPKADQDKFNAWAKSVAAHEKLHYDTYKKGFDGMKTAITGPTEADCDGQYKTARDAIEPLQDAIDANQQPAPLAAPGGMIKVPSSGVPAPAKPKSTSEDGGAAAPASDPPT